jgi:DNA-binding response OmpR family regulator
MLTARAQETDVEHGFAAGADDYIVKPFSPRELTTRVAAAIAAPRRAAPADELEVALAACRHAIEAAVAGAVAAARSEVAVDAANARAVADVELHLAALRAEMLAAHDRFGAETAALIAGARRAVDLLRPARPTT